MYYLSIQVMYFIVDRQIFLPGCLSLEHHGCSIAEIARLRWQHRFAVAVSGEAARVQGFCFVTGIARRNI